LLYWVIRYLSKPLFVDVPAERTEEEREIRRSSPMYAEDFALPAGRGNGLVSRARAVSAKSGHPGDMSMMPTLDPKQTCGGGHSALLGRAQRFHDREIDNPKTSDARVAQVDGLP